MNTSFESDSQNTVVLLSKVCDAGHATPRVDCTLGELARQILSRDDRLREGLQGYWLFNGRDLLKAKSLAGHGHFEAWCNSSLNYSKSKVERLMRAAEMVDSVAESSKVTDFPKPSHLYALSAPSVPEAIRIEFLPRVLAKEPDVGPQLRAAIKRHRMELKLLKGENALYSGEQPGLQIVDGHRGAVQPKGQECQQLQECSDVTRQIEAQSAALAILIERIGDALSMLMTHVAQAGPSRIFSVDIERELQKQMAKKSSLVSPDAIDHGPLKPALDEASNEVAALANLDADSGGESTPCDAKVLSDLSTYVTRPHESVRPTTSIEMGTNRGYRFTHGRQRHSSSMMRSKVNSLSARSTDGDAL